MKLTATQLRQIIKEEVKKSLNEGKYEKSEVEGELKIILSLAGNIDKVLKNSHQDDIDEKTYDDVVKARELLKNINGVIVGKAHEKNPSLGHDINK